MLQIRWCRSRQARAIPLLISLGRTEDQRMKRGKCARVKHPRSLAKKVTDSKGDGFLLVYSRETACKRCVEVRKWLSDLNVPFPISIIEKLEHTRRIHLPRSIFLRERCAQRKEWLGISVDVQKCVNFGNWKSAQKGSIKTHHARIAVARIALIHILFHASSVRLRSTNVPGLVISADF